MADAINHHIIPGSPISVLIPTGTEGMASDASRRMQRTLNSTRERQQGEQDVAIAEWRCIPKGDGNRAFFVLAVKLLRAGMDLLDIRHTREVEAGLAHSPRERRREIAAIIKGIAKNRT